MNILKTRTGRVLGIGACLLSASIGFANVTGGVNPGYVKVKTYQVMVARDADCSNPISVFQNASPVYEDMISNPTLGSGSIPNGTYNCIMIHMSDFIHFTPVTTNGAWANGVCTVGADYVTDVGHDETAVDPDGSTHAQGAKGTEGRPWLYIRTGATVSSGGPQNAFAPTGGLPLTSPLVINGVGTHTMVFNFDGLIGEEFDNGAWSCACDAPSLSFR